LAIAQAAEQRAMAESIARWAGRAGTIAAVRELETRGGRARDGSWAKANWTALADLGVFSITAEPAADGEAGTIVEVAVAAEQLATALVPGPVLPTMLAAHVLASQPGTARLVGDLGTGAATVAVPFTPGGLTAVSSPDGGLIVEGTASLVLGAGDTSHLLLAADGDAGETWFLLDAERAGVHLAPRAPVDFSRALGDVTLTRLEVPADQVLSDLRPGLVSSLAATLAAAEAAGIAGWAVTTAADYARTRQQFGRPIGSFQAIKHLCAGMLGRAELTTAIAWDAASAASAASAADLPFAAAAAAALALDAAVDNVKDAIQVLGGIGFTWEHDAHLYLRRALALRQLLGGSGTWRGRVATLALEGARRNRRPVRNSSIIDSNDHATQVRKAARLVATAVSAVPPDRRRKGLAEVGYVAPAWPRPYGLGASPADELIIDEELAAAGITRPDLTIGNWAIPAIAAHGTPEQLERFAEPTLRGDITWCQLFSEPEAGSDLAALRTAAVRTAEGWRLTGQKVWTSLAAEADWAICLARTDPAAPKHQGISYFLVPMRSPGIEVRPLREITGREMFNQVFLDEVVVPDDCLVGKPGDGWKIARTTLATERVAMARGGGLSEELEALLAAVPADDPDPAVLDQVGALLAEELALSAIDDRTAQGESIAPSASIAPGAPSALGERSGGTGREGASGVAARAAVRKLLGVTHRQAVAEAALVLCGEGGAANDGRAEAAVHEFLLTRCLTIAGGTSQILLTLVAERGLGLPREEAR
jgi:alkylation response protein AidB-like acyl-CoA dehydrogenase